jgi:hypothetical protein
MAQKRIHGPALLSNVSAVKYTVPVGMRIEINHIHCINPSASVLAKLFMSLGADTAANRFQDGVEIAPKGQLDDFGPYTLEAGETIEAHSDQNNQMNLWIEAELVAV